MEKLFKFLYKITGVNKHPIFDVLFPATLFSYSMGITFLILLILNCL